MSGRKIAIRFYQVFVLLPWICFVRLTAPLMRLVPRPGQNERETCFVVTSVVRPVSSRLTYSETRSVFSAEDRIRQTEETVRSIRRAVPGAHVMVVEASADDSGTEALAASADSYLHVGRSRLVRFACDGSRKSFGEAMMLVAAWRRLPRAKRYFKMSGRYFLTSEFSLASFSGEGFSFKHDRPDCAMTALYSFSGDRMIEWLAALLISLAYAPIDYPMEYTLQKHISPRHIRSLGGPVGVAGTDGTNGAPFSR